MKPLNYSLTVVPLGSCVFIDIPESAEDCFVEKCIQCQSRGRFLTGDTLDDIGSLGHIICIFVWILVLISSLSGFAGNSIIIYVLKRQRSGSAFDALLIALAWSDMWCCIFSLVVVTCLTLYYVNISRTMETLYTYFWGYIICMFFKSSFTLLTIAISLERYLVVAFPIQCRDFFSIRKTGWTIVFVIVFSLLLAIPRYLTVEVIENMEFLNISATKNTKYLMVASSYHEFWYTNMNGIFNQIDDWFPLPILLLLNGLIYYHARRFTNSRTMRTLGVQRKEIRAVRMFIPVVLVHLVAHFVPVVGLAMVYRLRVTYRELYSVAYLAFAFNSAANLPIYYVKGKGFRKELEEALVQLIPPLHKWLQPNAIGNQPHIVERL